MADTALASPGRLSPILIVLMAFAILLGGAGALWAYYGTTVFFQMIATGWAYCF